MSHGFDPGDVVVALGDADDPVSTTGDVADAIGSSDRTARRKLTALHDENRVERKGVDGSTSVWWVDDPSVSEETTGDNASETDDYDGMAQDFRSGSIRQGLQWLSDVTGVRVGLPDEGIIYNDGELEE